MKKLLTHLTCLILFMSFMPEPVEARGLKVHNYTKKLNRRFKKKFRKSTKYIIVHTTEAGFESTLRTLTRGKRIGRYRRTRGGHANYFIARNGRVYSVVPHRYRSDHAGLSMWEGLRDISSHSIGIELVGYHYGEITSAQYKNLGKLLKFLMKRYRVRDKNVLTHSQVSYGRPNKWFRRNHRGRKRCAVNFDRRKAGLKRGWWYDPDVRAGRLQADPQIARVFYGDGRFEPGVSVQKRIAAASNIISKDNTAWNIAGEDYNSADTLYIMPGGRKIRGNRLERIISWGKIPPGTRVLLNFTENTAVKEEGPVFRISSDRTAWSIAGRKYRSASVKYVFPGNKIVSGNRVRDWDSIPRGTAVIVGFRGPLKVTRKNFSRLAKRRGIFFSKKKGFLKNKPQRFIRNLKFFEKI